MYKSHLQFYIMEGLGLAGFMLTAAIMTILMEHPDSPVMHTVLSSHPLLRRIPVGIMMGLYIMLVTLFIGKLSGAHINPALTWTFYRMNKITIADAIFYTVAQFAGAILAVTLLNITLHPLFSHSLIHYGVSAPKPPHSTATAFCAEFALCFILVIALLIATTSKQLEKYNAYIAGVLIALFVILELPLSGMSLNPARSLAAAIAAADFKVLWVYFAAPVAAMLLAAEVFMLIFKKRIAALTALENVKHRLCNQLLPVVPVRK